MRVVKQALKFGMVGGIATLVHMVVGVTLIHAGWSALTANFAAFLIAFFVSFSGHYGYSFADQGMRLATSFRRFCLVAVSGFGVNELLLAFLTQADGIAEKPALVVSTGLVATLNYLMSKFWAFKAPQHRM